MNKKLLLVHVLRPLARHKLRSFFMSVGIVLGVAALVVTRALGAGAKHEIMEKVNRMFSSTSIMVTAGGGGMGAGGGVTTLTLADLVAITETLDEIVAWDPFQLFPGQDVKHRDRVRRMNVWGSSEQAERVRDRGVIAGEPISAEDVAAAARVALIGTDAAAALFEDEDPIGQRVMVGSVPFQIKGVLEPYGMDPHGENRDDELQVPISTLMRRLSNVDYIQAATLLVDHPDRVEPAADKVAAILRERHVLARDEPDDFSLFTPAGVRRMVDRANRVLDVFLPAAAGLALLVAAIVIANLMLINVRRRVPEIGLRKAMGATDRQIRLQFLIEAVAMTFLSGLLGIALGVAAVAFATSHVRVPALLTADAVVLALLAATAVGVLAGVVPARRAARLDPIAALK